MRRYLILAGVTWAALASGLSRAQTSGDAATADKIPTLDVISVKADKNPQQSMMRLTDDGLIARGAPLHWLLTEAFHVNPNQMVGEPSWSTSELWAIDAKVEGDDVPLIKNLNLAQRLGMYQQILTDRFALKYHMEKRDLPEYALVVAKSGSRLVPSTPETAAKAGGMKGGPGNLQMASGTITGEGTTMAFLAMLFSRQLGRTVVDKTGLTGRYDFKLTWTPDDPTAASAVGSAVPSPGPSLFTAVQEQLGLKLEPARGPVDVVVIDHVEKPTQN